MQNKEKVIIDTDPGHDDMLAMLLMLAVPKVDVLAITTVAGNSTIQNVTNNARYTLDLAGESDVPLFSGAEKPLLRDQILADVHGESGLDGASIEKQEQLSGLAVQKILEIVRDNPHETSLLILGPQTNIAQAIQQDPDTMRLAKEFVIMGGAFNVPGNKNRVAEFNVCVDPEAAAAVAEFPIPKTYVPLDVCNEIQIPLEAFEKIENEAIRSKLLSALEPYVSNIQKSEFSTRGALMYDVLAAYHMINPEVCETEDVALVVETKGEYTSGMTLVDRRSFSKKEPSNATIVTHIPEQQFIDDYLAILNNKWPN